MNDTTENDGEAHIFYSSKPRTIHMAINIAIAPVLLYLLGIWPWPPTLPHYITFFITGLIGMRYAKRRLGQPRLALDEKGLYCGEFYPAESIRNVQTVMRALKPRGLPRWRKIPRATCTRRRAAGFSLASACRKESKPPV